VESVGGGCEFKTGFVSFVAAALGFFDAAFFVATGAGAGGLAAAGLAAAGLAAAGLAAAGLEATGLAPAGLAATALGAVGAVACGLFGVAFVAELLLHCAAALGFVARSFALTASGAGFAERLICSLVFDGSFVGGFVAF